MTVEELEIEVTAKIEPALKELKKLMPQIKQQMAQAMEQAQKAMEQIDMKKVSNKIQQGVQFIKKKIENLKKSNKNNEIAITVNNKEASKQISQLEREIESLQKKITGRQLKLDITNNTLDKMRADTNQAIINEMPNAGNKKIKAETYSRLDSNENYTSLVSESDKLNKQIEKYNELLKMAKQKLGELQQTTSQTATSQNKMGSYFNSFKGKIEQAKTSTNKLKNAFNQMPKITQNITNNIKNMSSKMRQGLGHVLKYATALFNLRSIYSTLSSSAQSWLGSQNAQAKQLSANIEYMKYAMGSVFAPVIEYITNLVYNLMKAVQSLVYAFSGVNIFAKATASSMKNTAGSAKQASKSLAGVHNEINNVSDKDNSGGSSATTPSIDLSKVDTQLSPLAKKLKDFFKPLVESWKKYGNKIKTAFKNAMDGIKNIVKAVWESIEHIITNGTVYNILENVLNTIGAIGNAWAHAWEKDNNGTRIVQGLADILEDISETILNLAQSKEFQKFADSIVSAIANIVETLRPVLKIVLQIGEEVGKLWFNVLSKIFEHSEGALKPLIDTLGKLLDNNEKVNIAMGTLKAIMEALGIEFEDANNLIMNGSVPSLNKQKDALDAVRKAEEELKKAQEDLTDAEDKYIDSVDRANDALERLKEAEKYSKESGKKLAEQVEQGKITYEQMNEKQKEVYKAYRNNEKAQDDLKQATEELTEAKKKEKTASLENELATMAEKGEYDKYKNAVVEAFEKGELSAEEAREKISNCMSGMSKDSRQTFVKDLPSDIKNGLNPKKYKSQKTDFVSLFNGAFTDIKKISQGDAKTWGSDLIQNMVTGIQNNKWKLTDAITGAASSIKKLIGFSEPEEGPLSNFHTYMPDMIDLMVKGIHSNMDKVTKELENLTAIMSLTINKPDMPLLTQDVRLQQSEIQPRNTVVEAINDILNDNEKNVNISIPLSVYVGNEKLGKILLNDLRNMRRQTGQGIEALVGG